MGSTYLGYGIYDTVIGEPASGDDMTTIMFLHGMRVSLDGVG